MLILIFSESTRITYLFRPALGKHLYGNCLELKIRNAIKVTHVDSPLCRWK